MTPAAILARIKDAMMDEHGHAAVQVTFPVQFMAEVVRAIEAEDVQQERERIVACIRSGTWGGSEEIVAMIRRRNES